MEAVGLEPIGEGKKILAEEFGDWHRWDNSVTAVIQSASQDFD